MKRNWYLSKSKCRAEIETDSRYREQNRLKMHNLGLPRVWKEQRRSGLRVWDPYSANLCIYDGQTTKSSYMVWGTIFNIL